MKLITYIFAFLILTSCGQSHTAKKVEQKISEENGKVQTDLKAEKSESNNLKNYSLNNDFKTSTIFELTDKITADFNGDGKIDEAIFKMENQTSGIIITHGQTNEEIRIGFGEPFAHLTEFNWVDFWGLVNDSETYEIVIEDGEIIGDRKVELSNPSIVVRRDEEGGGLITFKNGKYEWIHQAH